MVQKLAKRLCVLLPAKVDEQPLRRRVGLQQLEEEKRLYLDEKAESDDKMAKLEFALV